MNLKAAVIGAGGMGRNHARIYSELGILCGIVDTNPSITANLCHQYRVKGDTHLSAFLIREKPDVVTIAVPTPSHLSVFETCAKFGCHVLMEKPLSDNLSDAQKIIDISKEKGILLATGYIERFNPSVLYLKKQVKNSTYGEITSINIKRVGGIPRSADNVILDLMTHDFNILLNLFEKYPEGFFTHAHYRDAEDKRILDLAQVLLTFGTASATCESNWISPVKIRKIYLTGTKGLATVDLIKQEVTEVFSPDQKIIHSFDKEPLKEEIEGFLSKVKNPNEGLIVSGEEALKTLKLTLEVINN